MPEQERTARILIVDDEPAIAKALAKKLERAGYECISANSGEEALQHLSADDLDVVVTDVRMPGMSGIDLLKEIKARGTDVQVIMMTAFTDVAYAVEALRHKADDYLLKPFNLAELSHCVERSLEHRRLLLENRAYHEALRQQSGGGAGIVERDYRAGLASLSAAIELRNFQAGDPDLSVPDFALAAAGELGLAEESLRKVWLGAALRDVGMLMVPESVLRKTGPLSEREWSIVREHPSIGSGVVDRSAYLILGRKVVVQHHERVDGSGYPAGLKGAEIEPESRVVAVADAFAAMRSRRAFREALSEDDALAELESLACKQFDRESVQAFLAAHEKGFPTDGFELALAE